MKKISINQNDENGFNISLKSANILIENIEGSKAKKMVFFDESNNKIEIEINEFEFNVLSEKFKSYNNNECLSLSTINEEDCFRKQVKYLSYYSDRSIQFMLREIQSEILIDFLWYMKDIDLIKKILMNISERAREMILEDLENKWSNINPDNCLIVYAKLGRNAVKEINSIINRLIMEGQLEDFENFEDSNNE